MSKTTREDIERAVRDLFTNGAGETATRLVLVDDVEATNWPDVRRCAAAGVACFVKQLGSYPIGSWDERQEMVGGVPSDHADSLVRWKFRDRKGGDINEYPTDLRVREFPEVRA